MLMTGNVLGVQLQQIAFPLLSLQRIKGDEILLPGRGVRIDKKQQVSAGAQSQSIPNLSRHLAGKIRGWFSGKSDFIKYH